MFVRSPITPERSKEFRLPNVLVRFGSVLANVLTNAPEHERSLPTRIRSPITPERSIEYRLTNVLVRFWSVLANVLTNAPEQEFSAFPRTAQNDSPDSAEESRTKSSANSRGLILQFPIVAHSSAWLHSSIQFMQTMKRRGDKTHPCRSSTPTWNGFDCLPFTRKHTTGRQ